MTTSIEDKVVSLKFDNAQFSKGVMSSQKSLEQLNRSLQMKGATKGLDEVEGRASRFNLDTLAAAPKAVAGGFSVMAGAAAVALGNIASQAIATGATLLNSFTMQPIMDGFGEYETKMGSIQTILANTASKGTTLSQVTSALDTLNTYADKTIYNFAEMTHNIGLFTNAGLGVEESASMIKGFSNAAAASGTTSSAAANAAYQLSQALSAGEIKLMDWRSLTNAGMGNKNMQEGLIQIAEAMGTLGKAGVSASKVQEDFNESLSKGWLTADVMSKYLQIMAGDIDAATMAEMGLTEAQIEQFQVQQKNAEEAATKVRTFSQLVGTIQETVGSGWAKTFEILLGNFDEASELFTNINNVISPMVDAMSDARNNLLQGWVDLGGRKDIIDGLSSAFNTFSSIISTIGNAFNEIFPPVTAENLKSISEGFKNLMESLKPSEETLKRIGEVAKTVFAALKAGMQIVGAAFKIAGAAIGGVLSYIGKAFGMMKTDEIGESLGSFADKLSKWKGAADAAKSAVEAINKFFDNMKAKLDNARPSIESFGTAISNFFKKSESSSEEGSWISKFAEKWKSAVSTVTDAISKMSQAISNFFKRDLNKAGTGTAIWDSIKNATAKFIDWLSNINIGDLLKDAVQIGGLSAVFVGLVKVLKSFENVGKSTEGIFKSVQGMFNSFGSIGQGLGNALGSVQGALKGFENDLKAKALIKIAGAIGILALSLLVMSLIPLTALAGSVGAMGASMAALVGGLTVLDKYSHDPKKVMMMASALLIMAGAVFVMSIAAKYLAGVDTNSLIASSAAVITLLGAMVGMTRVMNGAGKKATKNVMLMLGMAIAVKILAKAVASIAELSPAQMGYGTLVIVALIGAMTAMTRLAGKGKGTKTGSLLKMVGVAVAVYILGKSVSELGSLETNALIKGTVATAVIIGALTLFSRFSKIKGGFGQALTFIAIAGSVYLIGKTVSELGSLEQSQLQNGVIATMLIMAAMMVMAKLTASAGDLTTAFASGVFLAIAYAVKTIGEAIMQLGALDQSSLIQGGVATALILGVLASIVMLMANLTNPAELLAQAVMWIALAATMYIIASSIAMLAAYPWESIAVAVVALLGAMLGLALISMLAQGSVGGAAAMLILSVAVVALAFGLSILAGIGLEGLAIAIVALAVALGVLLLAGFLAQTVAPGLAILAAAILAIGVACLIAGVGVLMLGVGMGMLVTALIAAGAVSGSTIVKMTAGLVAFAAAGLLAAPAALALGAGLLMMGMGLMLGGIGMRIMTAAIKPFIQAINQADQIGVIATTKLTGAITAIGGAATVAAPGMMLFGTGLVMAGVGLLAFAAGGLAAMAVAPLLGMAFSSGIDQLNAALGRMTPAIANFSTAASMLSTIATTLGTSVSTAFNSITSAIASCIPMILASCVMFQTLGTTVVTNIVTGLQAATPQITIAVTTLVMTLFTTFISRMALGQPMVYSGMLALAGHISLALARITGMVRMAINNLVSDMMSALSSGLSNLSNSVYASAMQTGYWMAEGLRVGFTNQRGALVEMARSTAAAMLAAANAELQVHSPSKAFMRTGHWAAEGLRIGWTDTAVKAVDAVSRTAEEFDDAFRDIISAIDMDEISDDINPVITPVLDLSKAKAGADDLRSMFGKESFGGVQNAASGIGARPSDQSSQNGSQKTVVFNQYNTSPKALSEAEIYRQTKSSISRIARV